MYKYDLANNVARVIYENEELVKTNNELNIENDRLVKKN